MRDDSNGGNRRILQFAQLGKLFSPTQFCPYMEDINYQLLVLDHLLVWLMENRWLGYGPGITRFYRSSRQDHTQKYHMFITHMLLLQLSWFAERWWLKIFTWRMMIWTYQTPNGQHLSILFLSLSQYTRANCAKLTLDKWEVAEYKLHKSLHDSV